MLDDMIAAALYYNNNVAREALPMLASQLLSGGHLPIAALRSLPLALRRVPGSRFRAFQRASGMEVGGRISTANRTSGAHWPAGRAGEEKPGDVVEHGQQSRPRIAVGQIGRDWQIDKGKIVGLSQQHQAGVL